MKKMLAILLVLALVLSVAACGKKKPDASADSSDSVGTTEAVSANTENTEESEETAPPHTHSYTSQITTATTCEKDGVKTFSCTCGDSYTEPLAAAGHSWDVWKNADEVGYLTRSCENCGNTETKEGYLEMNVLSIGNSYSQDAQRYLHQIAAADGFDLQVANLYYSGCSLATHHSNMQNGNAAYNYDINGATSGPKISLEEALEEQDWDVVTLQQVSGDSPDYSTYQPYLDELVAYVRTYAPNAKIVIHQTWAYEKGSWKLDGAGYDETENGKMLEDIKAAIAQAAQDVNADYVIPSGELFGKLLENNVTTLYRDTYHASFGIGRYALGLLWYRALTGNHVANNTFADFSEPITDEQVAAIKLCVTEIAAKHGL